MNPALNALVCRRYDERVPTRGAAFPTGRSTGVPFLMKDLGPALAGVPMTSGSRYFAGLRSGPRRRVRHAHKARRIKYFRQDQYARNGTRAGDRAGAVRTVPQSLGHRAYHRRIERRLGSRRRRGRRSSGPRKRHGRIDSHSGELQRHLRHEAQPRANADRRRRRRRCERRSRPLAQRARQRGVTGRRARAARAALSTRRRSRVTICTQIAREPKPYASRVVRGRCSAKRSIRSAAPPPIVPPSCATGSAITSKIAIPQAIDFREIALPIDHDLCRATSAGRCTPPIRCAVRNSKPAIWNRRPGRCS